MPATRPASPCNSRLPPGLMCAPLLGAQLLGALLLTTLLLTAALLLTALPHPEAQARPEKIRPGIAYFDDEYVVEKDVPDLVGEKNYEEVYQFYEYFEARYDGQGRVVLFVAYKRGDVVWRARIVHGGQGRAPKITVTNAEGSTIPLPQP